MRPNVRAIEEDMGKARHWCSRYTARCFTQRALLRGARDGHSRRLLHARVWMGKSEKREAYLALLTDRRRKQRAFGWLEPNALPRAHPQHSNFISAQWWVLNRHRRVWLRHVNLSKTRKLGFLSACPPWL